MAHKKTCSL